MSSDESKSAKPKKFEAIYVKVTDEEQADDPIELPVDSDGSIALSTVAAQYTGASGLKYRNPETGTYRGLKLDEHARIHPPTDGWGDFTFIVVFPKENTKRKIDTDHVDSNAAASKQKRVERKKCSDLIVLGLPYKTTEEELREYFEQFGEVLVSQVKRDPKSDKSKGFGFVRFSDYDSQLKVLSQRHNIEGRWCDVKIPNSKTDSQNPGNRKIFVGRLTENLTTDDLRDYFSKYGEITDVFIPKPFRGFAFVTFADANIAQQLCGEDYVIRHCSVHVSPAAPKDQAGGGTNNSRNPPRSSSYAVGSPSGGGGGGPSHYSNRSSSPLPDRRNEYYSYHSGPGSPQAKMNRSQVWSSFPSTSLGGGSGSSYSNPWSVGNNGNGGHHHDTMGLMPSSGGRSMTPVPPNQPPPPPPPPSSSVLQSSVNSLSASVSATNQATVGMGALNLGSFNIGSLLSPAINPALFAAAQAAILQTLAQTSQLPGSPNTSDISSALLGSLSSSMAQLGHVQQAPPSSSQALGVVSSAPAAWWPSPSITVPSSGGVPSAVGALTTTMSGEMGNNGNQGVRSVPVWSQDETWRK